MNYHPRCFRTIAGPGSPTPLGVIDSTSPVTPGVDFPSQVSSWRTSERAQHSTGGCRNNLVYPFILQHKGTGHGINCLQEVGTPVDREMRALRPAVRT